MPKTAVHVCAKCDAQFPKWSGRCESCGAWGSISQDAVEPNPTETDTKHSIVTGVASLSFNSPRASASAIMHATGFRPLDEALGGGLVDGSITLLAGEPGIGKSTLLAQLGLTLVAKQKSVLYITGEESPSQIKRRLERLTTIVPEPFHFLDQDDADVIANTIQHERPSLTIIDSIQTLVSSGATGEPGSVAQVKSCGAILTDAAKRTSLPIILVGQVTKDGDVAGPRVLEHLVDTVLFLEGDRLHRYRLLRVLKHRFGPTDDVTLLSMTEKGLEPVEDVSTELLRDRAGGAAGSSVTALLEGHRPLLLEIQALVSSAGFSTPLRRPTGIDGGRLGMLLAVLSRRAGIHALDKDVYANAAGGIDARDPSADLAIAAAIASAVKDAPLDPRLMVFGEVGLAGELRPVRLPEQRLKEAARLGFTLALVPKGQGAHAPKNITVKEAGSLREALQMIHIV